MDKKIDINIGNYERLFKQLLFILRFYEIIRYDDKGKVPKVISNY